MSSTTDSTLWTVADVSRYLRIPQSSVYKLTSRLGAVQIPHIKLAGRLRFRKADIDRWLETLAVSNVNLLEKVRRKAQEVAHGDHPQTKIA